MNKFKKWCTYIYGIAKVGDFTLDKDPGGGGGHVFNPRPPHLYTIGDQPVVCKLLRDEFVNFLSESHNQHEDSIP